MDPTPEKLAVGGAALTAAGFLGRWIWERLWRSRDAARAAAKQKQQQEDTKLAELELRMGVIEAKEDSRSRHLGTLESHQSRLDGKVDALQQFWRTEFTKLGDEFKGLEEKIDYRLDNLRMELRGDQQKGEDRLSELLNAHQQRVHDRLNTIAADQLRMMQDIVNEVAERSEKKAVAALEARTVTTGE